MTWSRAASSVATGVVDVDPVASGAVIVSDFWSIVLSCTKLKSPASIRPAHFYF
jgi:hypothetical protein